MADLEAAVPGVASAVESALGAPQSPDPDSGDPAARNFWLTGQIQGALGAGQFDRARQLFTRIDDLPIRGQISALITFSESASAIENKNDQAMSLANLLKPGIKRSLLYISMIAASRYSRCARLQVLPLATKDIGPLPAEQRVRLLSALASKPGSRGFRSRLQRVEPAGRRAERCADQPAPRQVRSGQCRAVPSTRGAMPTATAR